MGALAAILSKSGPPDVDLLRGMLEAPRHYGGAIATAKCGSCALGVVNGRDAHDSSVSEDGPWIAAFTGTLENAAEIAELAAARGIPARSGSPADIVAAAFQVLRFEAPRRMRGVFAAVVSNGSEMF